MVVFYYQLSAVSFLLGIRKMLPDLLHSVTDVFKKRVKKYNLNCICQLVVLQETSKELEQQHQKDETLSVRAYAIRFLKSNEPNIIHSEAEVPLTPDRTSDSGILDLSWDDSLTEVWIIHLMC